MAVQIQLRRDTAANWAAINPVLQAGELGFDLTSTRLKLGDGVTPWNDLPWYEEALIGTDGNVKPSTGASGVALNVDLDDPDLLSGLISRIIGQVVTNANGSYVRFENGLQVCWFQSDTETPTSGQTVAPWYHTDVTAFTFPAPFTSIPAVIPTSRTASNGLGVTVTGTSSGSCSLRGWGVNNGQWVRFGYVAVGRWK